MSPLFNMVMDAVVYFLSLLYLGYYIRSTARMSTKALVLGSAAWALVIALLNHKFLPSLSIMNRVLPKKPEGFCSDTGCSK